MIIILYAAIVIEEVPEIGLVKKQKVKKVQVKDTTFKISDNLPLILLTQYDETQLLNATN